MVLRSCPCPYCNGAMIPNTTWHYHKRHFREAARDNSDTDDDMGAASDDDGGSSPSASDQSSDTDDSLPPQYINDGEDSEHGGDDEFHTQLQVGLMCREFVELVTQGTTKTAVESVMKIISRRLAHVLQANNVHLPDTWYRIKKEAGNVPVTHTKMALCPSRSCNSVHEYDSVKEGAMCAECGTELAAQNGRPHMIMLEGDLTQHLRRLWAVPAVAKMLYYPDTRQPGDGDAWDGEALRRMDPSKRTDTICLSICTDGSVLKRYRNDSYVPVVVRILNLPPHIRTKAAALFLWGMVPPKVGNFKAIYHHLLRSLITRLDPELGEPGRQDINGVLPGGIEVRDAHAQRERVIQLAIVRMVEDNKGLPHVLCNKDTGSYVGVCPFCQVFGYRFHGATRYPSAVCCLPSRHSLRSQFKQEFASHRVGDAWEDPNDGVHAIAFQKPWKMTSELAYESGMRVEEGKADAENEPFVQTSPFCQPDTLGADYDVIASTIADLAHGLSNFVKDLYRLIGNSDSMKATPQRVADEQVMYANCICHTYHWYI